jgi:hypothetical protein
MTDDLHPADDRPAQPDYSRLRRVIIEERQQRTLDHVRSSAGYADDVSPHAHSAQTFRLINQRKELDTLPEADSVPACGGRRRKGEHQGEPPFPLVPRRRCPMAPGRRGRETARGPGRQPPEWRSRRVVAAPLEALLAACPASTRCSQTSARSSWPGACRVVLAGAPGRLVGGRPGGDPGGGRAPACTAASLSLPPAVSMGALRARDVERSGDVGGRRSPGREGLCLPEAGRPAGAGASAARPR